jgi:hypothetical protein
MFYEQVVSFSFLYILATAQDTSENHNLRHATLLYTGVATEIMDVDPKELSECNYCLFAGEPYIIHVVERSADQVSLLMTFTLFVDAS